MARYFSATAMGGKLYPEGLAESAGWSSAALVYYPEAVARMMASPYPNDSLVVTAQELWRIVLATGIPAIRVWIVEDLEDAARQIWARKDAQAGKPKR